MRLHSYATSSGDLKYYAQIGSGRKDKQMYIIITEVQIAIVREIQN